MSNYVQVYAFKKIRHNRARRPSRLAVLATGLSAMRRAANIVAVACACYPYVQSTVNAGHQANMELQAVIGQLFTIDGRPQPAHSAPGLLAQAPPSKAIRGRSRDSLFVHLTLTGRPEEYANLAQDLVDLIANHFYANAGSITANLRKAILEVNQRLLRFNLSETGMKREGAITCAVLRGQELFVVQAGEALALIGRNFGLERLPPKEPERVTPLGRTAGLDFRYYHNWLESGDTLLLADPRASSLPAEQLKPVLVDSTVEDGIPALTQLLEGESARLLLIEFTAETPIGIPETVSPLSPGSKRRITAADAPPLPARDPVRAAQHEGADASEGQQVQNAQSERHLPRAEDIEYAARQASAQTAFGLARGVGWLAALMHRLRPGAREQAEAAGEADHGNLAAAAFIAIAVPIVMGLIIGAVYLQRGRVARVGEIRTEMQQTLALASQQTDEAAARAHYLRVLNLAAEAELLRPGDNAILGMRAQALSALDRVDDVTRLGAAPLYEYSEGSVMSAVTLRSGFNGDFYTLDSANNRVFVHQTAEDYVTLEEPEPQEILFGGQAIGTHIVGRLLDVMWRPSGVQVANEGVAVLDTRGALLTYHPGFSNLRAAPLGLASEWRAPVAIAQFNERLYVLDRGEGQIWRYFPEGDGFIVNEAQRALSLPDLTTAVDIAIYSEDGSVIVLYEDGRLRRYGQDSLLWGETHLAASGLETPLVAPAALKIIGSGLNSSIFVADPGSGRIIQTSLGGTFLAQYKALDPLQGDELFARITDFDVAESPLRIFATAENRVYVATQN